MARPIPFRAALLAATMMGGVCSPAFAQSSSVAKTFDAANAAETRIQSQIDALTAKLAADEARITALEGGRPPPPASIESPDGAMVMATAPATARLVDAGGNTYGLSVSKIVRNEQVVADTSGVIMLKKVDHPLDSTVPGGVFQQNGAREWYGPVTQSSGGPHLAGDPSMAAPPPPPPPPSGGVPAPAAAVGYNVMSYGGPVVMGSGSRNWRLWDGRADVRTNADGTVTVSTGSSNGYNSHIVTAVPSNGNYLGTVFKGSCGGYYEMTFSFPGNPVMNNGWPSFWANDIQNQESQGGGLAHWPGQGNGYVTSIEWDWVEFMTGPGQYGGALHHWYGNNPYPATNSESSGSPFHLPAGTDTSKPHKYAGLHVPATATSRGYAEWYFDDKRVGNRISWDKYNANNGPPPREGSTAFAVMDERDLYMIAGSGPSNPITIYSSKVWQPSAACATSR